MHLIAWYIVFGSTKISDITLFGFRLPPRIVDSLGFISREGIRGYQWQTITACSALTIQGFRFTIFFFVRVAS